MGNAEAISRHGILFLIKIRYWIGRFACRAVPGLTGGIAPITALV